MHEFFQISPIISFAKNCEKPNLHNQRLLIHYGGWRVKNLAETILDQVL